MDVRAFGKGFEEFYDRVRREGVQYVRGNPSEIYKKNVDPEDHTLIIKVEDTLTATALEAEADMVVLGVGLEPRKDVREIIDLFKLSQSADGKAKVEAQISFVSKDECRGFGLGHRVRDVLRPLAAARQIDAVRCRVHRAQLGVRLEEEAVGRLRELEQVDYLADVLAGLEPLSLIH